MQRVLYSAPVRLLLCISSLCFLACISPDEFQGTYDEIETITDGRNVAYRMTFYQFGDEVGGVLRTFDLSNVSNTQMTPYGRESGCIYFERSAIGGKFAIEVPFGDSLHVLDLSIFDSTRLDGTVRIFVDDAVQDTFTIGLVRVSQSPDTTCEARDAFTVSAELPQYTLEDTPGLSLAIGFSGYSIDDNGIRRTTRTATNTTSVQQISDTDWTTRQSLVFPAQPPPGTMSAATDPK